MALYLIITNSIQMLFSHKQNEKKERKNKSLISGYKKITIPSTIYRLESLLSDTTSKL